MRTRSVQEVNDEIVTQALALVVERLTELPLSGDTNLNQGCSYQNLIKLLRAIRTQGSRKYQLLGTVKEIQTVLFPNPGQLTEWLIDLMIHEEDRVSERERDDR